VATENPNEGWGSQPGELALFQARANHKPDRKADARPLVKRSYALNGSRAAQVPTAEGISSKQGWSPAVGSGG